MLQQEVIFTDSEDGGLNWSKELGGPKSILLSIYDVDLTSQGVVYATISSNCNDKGIWRSTMEKHGPTSQILYFSLSIVELL